jgi:hypothetical protein
VDHLSIDRQTGESDMGVSVDTRPAPPPGSPADGDLWAAYHGGSDFLARLKSVSEARAAHDKALASLNLGSDLAAKADELRRQREEADAARAQAERARAEANRVRAAAKDEATRLVAEASELRARAKAEAERLVAETTALRNQTAKERDEAVAVKAAVDQSKQLLDAKQAELDAELADLRAVSDQLAARLSKTRRK